ncbi:MAG: hypothetical protein ACFFB3_18240, partial [Candidatus Hodarchaeota archaeon]
ARRKVLYEQQTLWSAAFAGGCFLLAAILVVGSPRIFIRRESIPLALFSVLLATIMFSIALTAVSSQVAHIDHRTGLYQLIVVTVASVVQISSLYEGRKKSGKQLVLMICLMWTLATISFLAPTFLSTDAWFYLSALLEGLLKR